MGNSLRANAERLLGDVQRVHSRLVAQIARVEREAGIGGGGGAGTRPDRASGRRRERGELAGDSGGLESPARDEDALDVPEFIPPG
jgi:hypothetical protein